tara:strand:- start:1108 stop:1443 length:336 start_codon:yes stop_codon:yes gene_type:complete
MFKYNIMEVDKLLLKICYLLVLLTIFYMILSSNKQISKINCIIISFLFSILGIYFTFNYLYNHLTRFITKEVDEEEKEEEEEEEEEHEEQTHSHKKEKDFIFDTTQYVQTN